MFYAEVAELSVQKRNNKLGEVRFGSVPVFARGNSKTPVLNLSPSGIATFRQCKLQYKFRYVDKLGDQYGKPRPYYTMANHVHATMHDLFSLVPVQNRTPGTVKKLLKKNWHRYRIGFRDKADEKRWAQKALAEVTRFIAEQDVTITPMMLERQIEEEITPGLVLRGKVDRVDKQPDGSLHVIDYKTGAVPENVDWTQLKLYALILSRSTVYIVSQLSYFYLLLGVTETRQLDRRALEETSWELLRVATEIRKERYYSPSPGPACAGCDFAVMCPARHEGYVQIGETELPLWRDFSDILAEDYLSTYITD